MPAVDLATSSALLTPSGWVYAGRLESGAPVMGTDRYGTLAERAVRSEPGPAPVAVTFVGTHTTFGMFVPATKLILADGTIMSCEELVEKGDVREYSFETHTGLPNVVRGPIAWTAVWETLGSAAAAWAGEGQILLRQRDPRSGLPRKDFPPERSYGDHRYCLVDRMRLAEGLERDWHETVLALGRRWLYTADGGRAECERDAYAFGLWFISALQAVGGTYRITYDSIQHSAYMFVEEGTGPNSPVAKTACAFRASSAVGGLRLFWQDPSWIPIVCGFLVSPNIP